MITCPRDDSRGERPPGTWQPRYLADGLPRASLVCPTCGSGGTLEDHEISAAGVVSPSVVCSTPGCSFHDYITLDGWKEFLAARAAKLN